MKAHEAGSPLASPSTLCRLENHIDRIASVRIAEVFIDQFIAAYPTPLGDLILDFDATDGLIHGNQGRRFFHG